MSAPEKLQAEKFYASFTRLFDDGLDSQPEHLGKMFQDSRTWTKFMLHELLPCVINEIANESLEFRHEFQNIDLCAWHNSGEEWDQALHGLPLYMHLAIEHENRAISGDGGFMYNVQELATAVQQKINAVVIVFNDSAFGNVLRDQRDRFQGRVYGSELHNPDFMTLAKAFGVRGARAATAEELEAQLHEALAVEAPTLIEVPCGPMPYPY